MVLQRATSHRRRAGEDLPLWWRVGRCLWPARCLSPQHLPGPWLRRSTARECISENRVKSLGLMDPPGSIPIDQLRAKEKVRGRAGGAWARGAGCLAAVVKAFGASKEEGQWVAAQAPQAPFPAWARAVPESFLYAPLCPMAPPPDPGPGGEADAWKTPGVFSVLQAPLFPPLSP